MYLNGLRAAVFYGSNLSALERHLRCWANLSPRGAIKPRYCQATYLGINEHPQFYVYMRVSDLS